LENAALQFDLSEDTITIHNSDSTPTVVEIRDAGFVGMDRTTVSHNVVVSKRCVSPDGHLLDLNNLGLWNSYTSILSAIADESGLKVVARLNLYDGEPDVIKHLYAPLAYWAVWLAQGLTAYLETGQPNAYGFVRGFAPKTEPWWFGIPEDAANHPPEFYETDFKEAVSLSRERGLIGTAGDTGLTIELPWDPDALGVLNDAFTDSGKSRDESPSNRHASTQTDEKRTSLLVIQTDQPHPLFGKGTLVTLRLPVSGEPSEVPNLVNRMNIWELEAADTPPFFGSWCIDRQFRSSPAYVMFVPSMLRRTMTIVSLMSWMYGRHRAARGYLQTLGLH